MPVDSVDNYTVFRVIHSIAFRSSVFCSADKVREVVETRFFESYRQCSKPVSTFRHLRIVNIRFSFFVHIPNHTLRKLFFAVFLFCLYRAKDGFCKRFRVFFSKVIAGLSTSFVGLFDHLINNPVGYLPVIGFDAGVDRHRRRSRVSAFHNGLYDRYFSQQVYAVFLGEAAGASLSEEVVTVFGQLFRGEPGHVFDDAGQGDVHLRIAEHLHAAPHIGHGDLLGGSKRSRPCRFSTPK